MSKEDLEWVSNQPKTAGGETIFPKPVTDDEWRRLRRIHQTVDTKGMPKKSGAVRMFLQEPDLVYLDEEGNEASEPGLVSAYWLSWGTIGGDTMSVTLYREDDITNEDLWQTALAAWRTRYDLELKPKFVHAYMASPTRPVGLERAPKVGELAKVKNENEELKARLAEMEKMMKKLTEELEDAEENRDHCYIEEPVESEEEEE